MSPRHAATPPPSAPPSPSPGRPPERRDWAVLIGMAVAATAATLASFSGLRGLAELAGWPDRLAWLLPVTLDAYAMTSARVWLAGHTTNPATRRFARANALGAITLSITGNAAYHSTAAGLLDISWPVVVLVGAVPAAILGLTAHLHALQGHAAPAPKLCPSRTTGRPSARHPATNRRARKAIHRSDDDLLAAALAADAHHRETHDGRPITRDALRVALRISGPRATELRRRLANGTHAPERKETETPR
jgi:hypothetical protein